MRTDMVCAYLSVALLIGLLLNALAGSQCSPRQAYQPSFVASAAIASTATWGC
jgi:hypothetical protein